MSAHLRPGAGLAALLSLLAVTAAAPPAHAQTRVAERKWSTYLGGSGLDRVTALVQEPVDNDVVVAGSTTSKDFPPRTGTGANSTRDAFLAVFTEGGFPRGSPFLFGGTGEDVINAVALGNQGQIYAVGTTQTPSMPGFPLLYRTHGGGDDAFLARFTRDGTPEWIMYLDSAGSDSASGVLVSGTDIYVTGYTTSCAFMGNSGTCLGGREAFVVKISNSTVTPGVSWRILVTGNGDDAFTSARVDGQNLLVTGSTASTVMAIPPISSFQGGPADTLLAGLNAASGAVNWVEYLGGTLEDRGVEVLPAGVGETVVVGTTGTSQAGKNAFATWINSGGAVLRTQTFGGTGDEVVSCATVDERGNLYIGGLTHSTDFPLAREFDRMSEGNRIPPQEGFVLTVPARGGPGWASYLGGDKDDDVLALSILGRRLIAGGETTSVTDLVAGGGYDAALGTPPDGFLFAVDTDITPPSPGIVADAPVTDETGADIDEQTSTTSLAMNWTGFADAESDIDKYEYAFGTTPGGDDVVPFTQTFTLLQTAILKTGLVLERGRTYYATVRAINGAGDTVLAVSDGVKVVPVLTDGGSGNPDGGSGDPDGGSGNPDGGSGNPDGGTADGGSEEQPEDGSVPLMGWSCSVADAGLPMVFAWVVLMRVARRRAAGRR